MQSTSGWADTFDFRLEGWEGCSSMDDRDLDRASRRREREEGTDAFSRRMIAARVSAVF